MPNLGEPYRPRSSQRVSLSWEEDQASESHRRLMQVQFAEECIETKTVTTTTTTKRAYPPLFVRGPRDLNSLDSKQYPLASRPTPPSLRKMTFALGDEDNEPEDTDDAMDLVSQPTKTPFPKDYLPTRHAAGSLPGQRRQHRARRGRYPYSRDVPSSPPSRAVSPEIPTIECDDRIPVLQREPHKGLSKVNKICIAFHLRR